MYCMMNSELLFSPRRTLTTDELYLVDSGAQYKDGTTDVTRTLSFGTPTQHQKDCFTRVLKGQIRYIGKYK